MNEQEIIALFTGPSARSVRSSAQSSARSSAQSSTRSSAQSSAQPLDDCSPLPDMLAGGRAGQPLITTDSMVEGSHFRLEWSSPEDLAIKLFHINLSDLAASGAEPAWTLLNLGLPAQLAQDRDFLTRFAQALLQQCRCYSAPLLGGDTFRSPVLFLSLAMAGFAPTPLWRGGGQPGDILYLTERLGLSLAGLWHLQGRRLLTGATRRAALKKHLQPQVNWDHAKRLRDCQGIRAAIDISDGLFIDAGNLCQASQVDLEIDLEAIPIAEQIAAIYSIEEALGSGEELGLLFLGKAGLERYLPCWPIGRAKPPSPGGASLHWLRQGVRERPKPLSYCHFPC